MGETVVTSYVTETFDPEVFVNVSDMFPLPLVGASEISAFASLTQEKVLRDGTRWCVIKYTSTTNCIWI